MGLSDYRDFADALCHIGRFLYPMPVYEMVANLGIFIVIWRLRRRNLPDGLLFLVYLSINSLMCFFLVFTSSHQILAWGLTQSQIVAILLLALSLPLIFWVRSRSSRTCAIRFN